METPRIFAIFFHVKPIDLKFIFWFMSAVKFGLPLLSFEVFGTKKRLNYFEPISISSKRNIKKNDLSTVMCH